MLTNKFLCVICSEALASNNMYSTLCGHVFHINCIENWITQVKKKVLPKMLECSEFE
uniref:RING-type domain-containing protein n=1 Tax=Meloidogyne incognita TaxID=6306 RepID=A0A914M016_MELIC